MAEVNTNSEMLNGPELVSNVQHSVENSVSGIALNEKDSVYRTHLKEFDAIQASLGKQQPEFWENVMAHIYAAGKQAEYSAKDYVYWALRGGPFGSAARFVGEHLPVVGGVFRSIDRATDATFKPSEREKQRVAVLTNLRVSVHNIENRISGTVGWIMGKR